MLKSVIYIYLLDKYIILNHLYDYHNIPFRINFTKQIPFIQSLFKQG